MPIFAWIISSIVILAERIASWFVKSGIKTGAFFLGYVAIVIGLYAAFLAATYLAVTALRPAVPPGVAFGLSMLPASTPFYTSAYFTALIGKRVFDWHKQVTRDFTQATLRF